MIDTDSKLLIAGGSSGMGLALARLSLGLGAQVVLVGRDEAKLARAGTMLGGRGRLELLTADITCEDAVAKTADAVDAPVLGVEELPFDETPAHRSGESKPGLHGDDDVRRGEVCGRDGARNGRARVDAQLADGFGDDRVDVLGG